MEKIAKAPRLPAAWFMQGSAFHKAIEDYEQSGRCLAPELCVALYEQEWKRLYAEAAEQQPNIDLWLTGGRVKPADDIARRYERGAQQVRDYISWAVESEWQPVKIGSDYACEYPFELDLDGVRVIGSIDQIVEHKPTGRLMVRDLKTGTSLPSSRMQLAVYDIAIGEEWGYRPGWGDYFMAKNNAPTAPYDLSSYTFEKVSGFFAKMDAGVKAGIFLPNPGDACRTCGVSFYCSELGTTEWTGTVD